MLGCWKEICEPQRILGSMLLFGQEQGMYLSPLLVEKSLDDH